MTKQTKYDHFVAVAVALEEDAAFLEEDGHAISPTVLRARAAKLRRRAEEWAGVLPAGDIVEQVKALNPS